MPTRQSVYYRVSRTLFVFSAAAGLSACAYHVGPGPYRGQMRSTSAPVAAAGIAVIDVTEADVQRVAQMDRPVSFASEFTGTTPAGAVVGMGDTLAITMWEAPPAALFAGISGGGLAPANAPAEGIPLPEQVVSTDGSVMVPFVGEVHVAGRTPVEISREIVARLRGKANHPQAVVRIVRNANETVTVVGDVVSSTRMPLSPKGERVLDALAAAGGVKQPVAKTVLQLSRGTNTARLPLTQIIADPTQNVMLSPGDVVTALYQPYSFNVLGATGKNEEVPFEATGLTLAQALARAGGLVDARADAGAVYVFRMENAATLAALGQTAAASRAGADGKAPVVYHFDLRNPATFFIAQNFRIHDGDTIYVSNSSTSDLQRFLTLIGSIVSPAATVSAIRP